MSGKFDVVIVGAGVAGLYIATQLSSMGWKVVLIESKPAYKIGDRVCGDAIGLHHFNELGLRVPEEVIDTKYHGVKIYSPSRKHSIVVPGEGVSVNRLKFGQWLLKKAIDSGSELLDQHVVYDVELKNGNVKSLRVKKVGGGSIEVEGRVFIDASGYKPAVRSKLPSEWPISERPYITDYNIAYREVLETDMPAVSDENRKYALIYIDVEVAPGGYWWLFPKRTDGRFVNIGLGVINNGKYNPRYQYERYLRKLLSGRVIHSGGGVVPTRRPIYTLVWRNVVVVGDAAYTVNPVHGGGIGSSMLSSHIVSKYVNSALEAGVINEEYIWQANVDYMYAYGGKQASLDILRMFMQKLSNDDYEWIMENRIVDGESVYDLGIKGDIAERVAHAISTLIKLLGKPSLLNQLRIVKNYMSRARGLYTSMYPRKPSDIYKWIMQVEKLFDSYVNAIGYDRGSLVKW